MSHDALDEGTLPVSALESTEDSPVAPDRSPVDRFVAAMFTALPAWLVTCGLTFLALLLAKWRQGGLPITGEIPDATGWWSWDAGWYRWLAEHGYAGSPAGGVRFFPLFPLMGRGLAHVTGDYSVAMLLIANLCAFGYAVAVIVLVRRELDGAVASRAVWLTMLAPGAAVLALAYTEPVLGLLTATYFLAVRSRGRAMWWAVPIGLLAGLGRPTGVLLAVVPVVELGVPLLRRQRPQRVPALVAAAAAPLVGSAIYCVWSWIVYHDVLLPYSSQTRPGLRGTIIGNPIDGLLHPHTPGALSAPPNIVMATVALVLLALAWWKLPPSIAAWATLAFLSAVTAGGAMSLPRYLSSDFPLLIALAYFLRARWQMVGITAASATCFVLLAMDGFGGGLVF